MDDVALGLAQATARAFRRHVVEEAVPRIRHCVVRLDTGQVWRRHGEQGNAVGNLLLHLEGNVRQWILSGIGGVDDARRRDSEFATRESDLDPIELVDRLEETATQAAAIVDALTPAQLVATRTFQGRYERCVAEAVLHVLEHFSGHAYQIYAWTKQMKGVDLKFWDL